jgi:flagellin-like protein
MEKKGVSPVVGTILLIAITVALAAIVAMLVSGLSTRGAPPSVMLAVTAENGENAHQYTLMISHESGDVLVADDLEVQVSNSAATMATGLPFGTGTGTFKIGDKITMFCDYDSDPTGKAITVYIIHKPSKQKLFSSSTVIVE